MQMSNRQKRVLDDAVDNWLASGLVSEEHAGRLRDSYEVLPFDWKRLAKYCFLIAITCLVISIFIALSDRWIIELLLEIFSAPDMVKAITFAALAGWLYWLGIKRKRRLPNKIIGSEVIFLLGGLSTAVSVFFFATELEIVRDIVREEPLLLAAVVYGALALWLEARMIWLISLMFLGIWFGTETDYFSLLWWENYLTVLHIPIRFLLLGLVLLTCGSYLFSKWESRCGFLGQTKMIGFFYVFLPLWYMSVPNPLESHSLWGFSVWTSPFNWSVAFTIVALGAILYGIRFNDAMARGFGLVFVLANLYTKFFQYLWADLHLSVAFAVLAVSFWLLGARMKAIWLWMQFGGVEKNPNQQTGEDNHPADEPAPATGG